MTTEQFKNVAINDIVFMDLSQWKIDNMTGKVIDRGEDWFRLYVVKADGSWFVSQWHCYFITSIVEKASGGNNDELVKLKAMVQAVKTELKRIIGMLGV